MTVGPGSDVLEFRRKHEIRVGDLSTPILMRVYRKADNKLLILQSHFIKTGIQYLPYVVNVFEGVDETAVLSELEKTILGFYDQALRRGYTPSESWLMPNSAFRDE